MKYSPFHHGPSDLELCLRLKLIPVYFTTDPDYNPMIVPCFYVKSDMNSLARAKSVARVAHKFDQAADLIVGAIECSGSMHLAIYLDD